MPQVIPAGCRLSLLLGIGLVGCTLTAPPPMPPSPASAPAVRPERPGLVAGDDGEAADTLDTIVVLERDALVAAVLQRNPGIDAARYSWKAASARPAQVTLDYPMLRYELAPLSIGSDAVDFGENVELSQALPWPGKLRRQREAAAETAQARFGDFEEARIDIALEATRLFNDYYLVARALEINAEHVRLLTEFKRAATGQYAAGLLGQQEPLKAEVELAHLAHRDVVLEAERRVIAARINALLHRPPAALLPPPPPLLPALDEAEGVLHVPAHVLQRLEEVAVGQRPEIAAADAEHRARSSSVALARLEAYPDLGIMGSYSSMWEDEKHRWMAGVSLSLPLWRQRIDAALAEAEAELMAAERRRQALEDTVRSRVHQAYQRASEAHHVAELYVSRLLPAAHDQLRAARAGVETGTTSFLTLIDAERAQREAQLGYHEALTDLDRRLAELARQLGCLPGQLPAVIAAARPATGVEGELR